VAGHVGQPDLACAVAVNQTAENPSFLLNMSKAPTQKSYAEALDEAMPFLTALPDVWRGGHLEGV
jgi:hypothetical protein